MASFGVPPDPARIVSYFPGMSARSFSPIGASVCYRECIMKENTARSDAFESAQRSQVEERFLDHESFSPAETPMIPLC